MHALARLGRLAPSLRRAFGALPSAAEVLRLARELGVPPESLSLADAAELLRAPGAAPAPPPELSDDDVRRLAEELGIPADSLSREDAAELLQAPAPAPELSDDDVRRLAAELGIPADSLSREDAAELLQAPAAGEDDDDEPRPDWAQPPPARLQAALAAAEAEAQALAEGRSDPFEFAIDEEERPGARRLRKAYTEPDPSSERRYRFIDRTRIQVEGGRGGSGAVSFASPGPGRKVCDGGDGGRGGDVVVRADRNVPSLALQVHHFNGAHGTNGRGRTRHGRRGRGTTVLVPVGTVVSEPVEVECEDTWEIWEELRPLADLDVHGAEVLVARGGRPGLGNRVLAGNRRREKTLPAMSTPGERGEARELHLELKTIADVGLVGYPNAGKSTLLGALSLARPKVAAYPFTTLHPRVGVVEFADAHRLTVADIPGLVDGAHANRGLGHEFLRHVERTRALLFVLDASQGGAPAAEALAALERELELFGITGRRALVVANKLDLLPPEAAAGVLGELRAATELPVVGLSAKEGLGVGGLAGLARGLLPIGGGDAGSADVGGAGNNK